MTWLGGPAPLRVAGKLVKVSSCMSRILSWIVGSEKDRLGKGWVRKG